MILYIYYKAHTDHNEHTRILAVRYLLQTCSVVEKWCNLYRAACASEISTYFVIHIEKHFKNKISATASADVKISVSASADVKNTTSGPSLLYTFSFSAQEAVPWPRTTF